jgi:hypothetical protein
MFGNVGCDLSFLPGKMGAVSISGECELCDAELCLSHSPVNYLCLDRIEDGADVFLKPVTKS